jgi:hypothetical protein
LNMELPRDRIAWMQDMMLRLNVLQRPVDFDATLVQSVRQKALQLVGTR